MLTCRLLRLQQESPSDSATAGSVGLNMDETQEQAEESKAELVSSRPDKQVIEASVALATAKEGEREANGKVSDLRRWLLCRMLERPLVKSAQASVWFSNGSVYKLTLCCRLKMQAFDAFLVIVSRILLNVCALCTFS